MIPSIRLLLLLLTKLTSIFFKAVFFLSFLSQKDDKMQFVMFPKIQKRHKAFFSKVLTLETVNVKLQMSLQKGSLILLCYTLLLFFTVFLSLGYVDCPPYKYL